MSTIVVTSNADSGPGTLRQAIADANFGGTITFDPSVTLITLTSGDLAIENKTLNIVGNGARELEINGNNAWRIFDIIGFSVVTLSGLRMTNGSNIDGGGAIRIDFDTFLEMNYCTLNNNTAPTSTGDGGAIKNFGTTTINYSLISNNTAGGIDGGAGIYNENGTLNINNSTITANNSSEFGGGIYHRSGTISCINVTITNNTVAQLGGNIYALNGTVTLGNTIVAEGIAGNPTTNDLSGDDSYFADLGGNFIGNRGNITVYVDGVDDNQVGDSGSPIDPSLGALADNGGPTDTQLPNMGSPVINASKNSNVNSATDQRGSIRIIDSIVDVGAIEANSMPLCFSGEALVLCQHKGTLKEEEIRVKNIMPHLHKVFDVKTQKFIDIVDIVKTGITTRFMCIYKNAFRLNKPHTDLYITSGHKLIVGEREIKAGKLSRDFVRKAKVPAQPIYCIVTDKGAHLLVNGIATLSASRLTNKNLN